MLRNKLREKLANKETVLNGWIALNSTYGAEAMAWAGYDSITIDLQHGMMDLSETFNLLEAMEASGVGILCRLPWNDPMYVMKLLDWGIDGIICPMINSVEEVEKLMSYAYYPPKGIRSFGPWRAFRRYGSDYVSRANDEILVLPMFETKTAFENNAEILALDGVSGCFIGPTDASLSLNNKPLNDRKDEQFMYYLDDIAKNAKEHDKIAGIFTASVEYAKYIAGRGYNFITLGSDIRILEKAAAEIVHSFN